MRQLAQPTLWRTAAAIMTDYLVIAGAIVCALHYRGIIAYLAVVLTIGGRQHSLLILMHEAAHGNLSRNRRLNSVIGQLFCAWPVFVDVTTFRHWHLLHHRHEGGPGDPDFEFRSTKDWAFPQPRWRLVLRLVLDAVGFGAYGVISYLRYYGRAPRERRLLPIAYKIAFYAAVLTCVVTTGTWRLLLLYWVVPMLTTLKCFVRWREIAEHYGLPADHLLSRTRTTDTTFIEAALIAPLNINFHLEHHLYPGIPWHSLPALRRELLRDPGFCASSSRSSSYWAVLSECALTSHPTRLDEARPSGPSMPRAFPTASDAR